MPRKRIYLSDDFPYHVTARVNNREPYPIEPGHAWKILTDELYLQALLLGCSVHAFVMMPNHFHLLISTREHGLARVMQNFMSSTTKLMNLESQRSGHLYGGHYHWSLIRDPLYYAHALKYVYRNPVKAQLCTRVEDYPNSTISGLVGRTALPLLICRPAGPVDHMVPAEYDALLAWLNRPHRSEEALAIQRALRRKEFKLPVNPHTRKTENLTPVDAV
jgi:putative transposase